MPRAVVVSGVFYTQLLVTARRAELLQGVDSKLVTAARKAKHMLLHRIQPAAQRMEQLISDLLRLSRIGRVEIRTEEVDLSAVVTSLCEGRRAQDPDREVDLVVVDGARDHGDPSMLRIALDNLVGNAWKFTSRRERARIEFGETTDDGERVFFLRDNGAGFDMDHAKELFGSFQRLHADNEYPGTGIGLAIVRRVVHRHGGRVWAEAEADRGATFYFTLVAQESETPRVGA